MRKVGRRTAYLLSHSAPAAAWSSQRRLLLSHQSARGGSPPVPPGGGRQGGQAAVPNDRQMDGMGLSGRWHGQVQSTVVDGPLRCTTMTIAAPPFPPTDQV